MVVQSETLKQAWPGLVHGFSGEFPKNWSYSEALIRLLNHQDVTSEDTVLLAQPHGPEIWFRESPQISTDKAPAPRVAAGAMDNFVPGFDGVTSDWKAGSKTMLAIRSADCVPVLAIDPERKVFGALHAGWRGTAAGILPNLLAGWKARGSRLNQVRLVLGPAIGPCCFEVGPECVAAFNPEHLAGAVSEHADRPRIDLPAVLIRQAEIAGLSQEQVEPLGYCTRCYKSGDGHHPFASFRRAGQEGGSTQGRNLSFIGVIQPLP